MDFFLLIGGIWFLSAIYQGYKNNAAKEQYAKLVQEIAEEKRLNQFQANIIEDTIKGEDYDWDVFNIRIKGIIEGPHDNFDVKFQVRAFDITDGEETPVYSTFEDFQAQNSRVFFYESEIDEMPYQDTIFKDWWTVTKVPKLFLEYPRSGSRKIKFKVFVFDPTSRNIYMEDSVIVTYTNDGHGYLDRADNIEYFEEMLIKTAMLVSASDGDMDANEASVVKSWIQKRLSGYNDHAVGEAKERLNSYVKDVYQEIKADSIDIYEVLEGIENIASEGEKFELFQICLDVAQADGEADDAELKIIHEIAEYIKLDRKQFRSMIEKTLPVTMHVSQADDEMLLGIDSSMSDKEIKKHLREQYQKWNARVASSDSATREQAEKMIHLIAEARKKYT
jgi:tellurite resistance protein